MKFAILEKIKKRSFPDVVAFQPKEVSQEPQPINVSDADKYKAIADILENVWLELTNNMSKSTLQPEQYGEWVEILQWALEVLPSGYDKQREIIQSELDYWIG